MQTDRRQFLGTLATAGSAAGLGLASTAKADEALVEIVPANRGRIFKSVKWGMVKAPSVLEKFQLCKELGYDGMELNSPIDVPTKAILAASAETDMPVHGLVDMKHWQIRLSSPDAAQRTKGREILEQAIRDCRAWGGSSVLLVPGAVRGETENHQHVWDRSIVEIRKTLPLASRLGVHVLIENVWNGFCETPDLLRDYIDEIGSPWVGVYFDVGNARKFAPSEEWVRTLGKRIVKLDIKEWSAKGGFRPKIGSGDVDWPAVREALADIGFAGWCTAEVGGGERDRLAEIATNMNKVLAL